MFDKIAEKISAQGIPAHKTVMTAGLYFDGEQHGELLDCVFASVEKSEFDYNCRAVESAIRRALAGKRHITFRRVDHPFYYTYYVAKKADFDRADALNVISKAFHDGFWQAIHDLGDVARENNSAVAIQAGREAIKALGGDAAC